MIRVYRDNIQQVTMVTRSHSSIDMDLFGDSDDEDGRGAPAVAIVELLNGLFTALVKHRSRNRASEDLAVGDLAIAVIVDGAEDLKLYSEPLLLKLRAAKFNNVTVTSTTNDVAGPVDAIVYFSSSHSHPAATLWHLVVPGGHVLVLVPEQCFAALCGADRWVYEGEAVTAAIAGEQYLGAVLRKRVLKCNTDGALYWATLSDQMEREVALAAEVTVCLTTHERSQGLLTDGSVQAAATALSTHGVVVIRGLFNAAAVVETAKLALLDLALAQEELLRRGIDLTRPGCGGRPESSLMP